MEATPELCPLCGRTNDCRLCTVSLYKDECWCARVEIPVALIQRVPPESLNHACICRACVEQFHQEQRAAVTALKPQPGEFYLDASGLTVFTAAYHLRRGHCCHSNCRHCPYKESLDRVNRKS